MTSSLNEGGTAVFRPSLDELVFCCDRKYCHHEDGERLGTAISLLGQKSLLAI